MLDCRREFGDYIESLIGHAVDLYREFSESTTMGNVGSYGQVAGFHCFHDLCYDCQRVGHRFEDQVAEECTDDHCRGEECSRGEEQLLEGPGQKVLRDCRCSTGRDAVGDVFAVRRVQLPWCRQQAGHCR